MVGPAAVAGRQRGPAGARVRAAGAAAGSASCAVPSSSPTSGCRRPRRERAMTDGGRHRPRQARQRRHGRGGDLPAELPRCTPREPTRERRSMSDARRPAVEDPRTRRRPRRRRRHRSLLVVLVAACCSCSSLASLRGCCTCAEARADGSRQAVQVEIRQGRSTAADRAHARSGGRRRQRERRSRLRARLAAPTASSSRASTT